MSLDQETEMSIAGGVTRTSLKMPDLGSNSKVVLMVIVGSVVLNVLLLSFVGVLGHRSITEKKVTCDETPCILTAGAAASSMNKSHPACSDLYEYTCGGYKLHHNIPDGKYGRSVWDDLSDTHAKRMRSAIESVDTTTKYGKEVNALYESCIDVKTVNATSAKILLNLVNNNDYMQWPLLKGSSWSPSSYDFTKAIKTLHHLNVNAFFTFTRGPNPTRPNKGALKIFPSGLNMYKWDYTSTSNWAAVRLAEYKDSLIELAIKLGADNVTATKDISDAVDFEKKLAKRLPDYRSDIYKPAQTRMQGLYRGYIQIVGLDWEAYVKELFPKDKQPKTTDIIFVEDKPYFANISELVSTTSPRVVANYMIMSLMYQMSHHLPEELGGKVAAHKRYYYDKSPLTIQCSTVISRLMPWAGLRAMLDKNLIADKENAKEIFYKLQSKLAENLDEVADKFTDKFAKQLKDRIYGLKEKLGYPDWIKDKDQVESFYKNMTFSLDRGTYFSNVIAMSKWSKTNTLTAVEEQYKDGQGWDYVYSDFEAGYYLQGNDISVPASYMYAPLYDHKMPAAFNYGGMGVWTAWYMSYALEDNWRKYYTKNGKVQPYEPSKQDIAALDEAKTCYNYIQNMTYLPPGLTEPIKIGQTYGLDYMHNDIIATSVAYKAFKKAVSFSKDYAPALPQDKDQLFFVAMGQFYCSATYNVKDYYHTLLNAMAASRPEFTSAFKCKKEDPLYNDGSVKCYL